MTALAVTPTSPNPDVTPPSPNPDVTPTSPNPNVTLSLSKGERP
jgi:hypothetical protein